MNELFPSSQDWNAADWEFVLGCVRDALADARQQGRSHGNPEPVRLWFQSHAEYIEGLLGTGPRSNPVV